MEQKEYSNKSSINNKLIKTKIPLNTDFNSSAKNEIDIDKISLNCTIKDFRYLAKFLSEEYTFKFENELSPVNRQVGTMIVFLNEMETGFHGDLKTFIGLYESWLFNNIKMDSTQMDLFKPTFYKPVIREAFETLITSDKEVEYSINHQVIRENKSDKTKKNTFEYYSIAENQQPEKLMNSLDLLVERKNLWGFVVRFIIEQYDPSDKSSVEYLWIVDKLLQDPKEIAHLNMLTSLDNIKQGELNVRILYTIVGICDGEVRSGNNTRCNVSDHIKKTLFNNVNDLLLNLIK